ncbi:hypothetical protein RvY_11024 [Ramazzottius varieornatus]|uniref:Ubiquitin-like domain-containing protein n=1 Tax=Ramazzottius varieornatus TaxID=947166 RepID=A0A1D1VJ57_RAMVA|nr:hypothetical protein RvY_11024 [Ramazzottius varieornatus]
MEGATGHNDEATSFLTALQQKYSDEDYRVLFGNLICQERQRQEKENAPATPEKRRNFMYPPYVVLQNFRINRVEPYEQLSEWCRHLTEIDLSFNQLSKWHEVAPLVRSIPSLESLNLSFNPLKEIRPEDLRTVEWSHGGWSNRQIKRLILNGTEIDWHVVVALLHILIGVEELHLSLNAYSTLTSTLTSPRPAESTFTVRELHIDSNQLVSWQSLMAIGQMFPALQTLFASQNPLRDLGEADDEELVVSFSVLRKLHVNQIEVEGWEALDKLHCIPRLRDLRLLGTKLWDADQPHTVPGSPSKSSILHMTPRQHVIARLPRVDVLNGTSIDSLERMDAERAFLRHFHGHDPAPRRYADLQAKHGLLTPLKEVDLGAPAMVDIMLSGPTFSKRPYRLNIRQSVGQLKKNLQSISGLSPSKYRLFYVDAEMETYQGHEELKYSTRALHSYHMADGDQIIIEPK